MRLEDGPRPLAANVHGRLLRRDALDDAAAARERAARHADRVADGEALPYALSSKLAQKFGAYLVNNASSEVGLSHVAFMENGAQKHAPPQKPSATPMFSYDAKYATVITEPFAQPESCVVSMSGSSRSPRVRTGGSFAAA